MPSSSSEEDGSRDEERRHQFFAGRGYARRRRAAAAASAVAAAKIEDVAQKPILEESEVEDGNWVSGVDFGALLAEHNDARVDAGAEGMCLCACCCCYAVVSYFCLVGSYSCTAVVPVAKILATTW